MVSLIIEILDHFGKVKERHRGETFPIKIGRDYSNHIILNDPYVSPSHITITEEDSSFIAIDNNSDNGLFKLHPFTKQQNVEIKDDTKIRIGHTDIRFIFSTHAVKETLIDLDKPSHLSMLANSNLTLPFAFIAFAITFMLNDYIESITATSTQQLLNNLFPIIIVVTLWALAWSILSKLVTRQFHFYFHATWAFSLTLMSIFFENIAHYYEFSFSLSGMAGFADFLFSILITSILFYGHLHYSTTFSKDKTAQASILSAFLILSLVELSAILDTPSFSNKPSYSSIIRPAAFVFVPAQPLDTFFSNTKNLKNSIDRIISSEYQ